MRNNFWAYSSEFLSVSNNFFQLHLSWNSLLEFSRPKYWRGYPIPSPGDLPKSGIKHRSPTLQADSLPAEPQGKPKNTGVGSLSLLQQIFLTQESNQVSCIVGRFFTNWVIRGRQRQVRWSGIPISLRIFQFIVIHMVKGFTIVNEAEVDVFLGFSCFFYDPMDVGNLISGSSAFSKSCLYIWNFSVHVLLKSSLKDFEHYLVSMWNECSCMVVWTFLALPFFGIGMKIDLFQFCILSAALK